MLEGSKDAHGTLVGVEFVVLLEAVVLVLADILHGEVEQFLFVAAEGDVDVEVFVSYVRNERHDDLLGGAAQLLAQFPDAEGEYLLAGLVQLLFVLDGLPLDDTALVDVQHGDIDVLPHFIVAEDIHVARGGVGDDGFALEMLEEVVLFLDFSGFFVAHLCRQLHHFRFHLAAYLVGIAFYDLTCGVHILPVFDGGNLVFADTATGAEVVLETDLVFALVHTPLGHVGVAGADGVEPVYQLDDEVERVAETVGTIVFTGALHDMARLEDAGELLLGDADAGVTFAVFEKDVVVGLVLLDEVVFEQEGVLLAVHYDVVYVGDVFDELFGLEAVLLFVEVTAHAAVEVLRLAHIDDLPCLIEVLVHARLLGDALEYLPYVLVVTGHEVCLKVGRLRQFVHIVFV